MSLPNRKASREDKAYSGESYFLLQNIPLPGEFEKEWGLAEQRSYSSCNWEEAPMG